VRAFPIGSQDFCDDQSRPLIWGEGVDFRAWVTGSPTPFNRAVSTFRFAHAGLNEQLLIEGGSCADIQRMA
jgi:hypothetical protein